MDCSGRHSVKWWRDRELWIEILCGCSILGVLIATIAGVVALVTWAILGMADGKGW